MEFENTATNEVVEDVTEQDVAAPAENEIETGSKEPEVAAPVSEEEPKRQDPETNAAFQRMRQEKEEALRELAEYKAQAEAREEAYARLTGSDNGAVSALAEVTGMSEDEILAEMDAAAESAQKDLRISQLEQQITDIQSERMMQADLEEIRKIDPTVKTLDDIGPDFGAYIKAGLDATHAYWACKGEQVAKQATPPKPAGKVSPGTVDEGKLTESQIDAMSSDQLRTNWKKVFSSWG